MPKEGQRIRILLASDADIHGDIIRGVRRRQPDLDLVRVQEVGLRTANDDAVLHWAATDNRVLITRDRKTMIRSVYERLQASLPMPGIIVLRNRLTVGDAIEQIITVALCSTEDELKDRIVFLPL